MDKQLCFIKISDQFKLDHLVKNISNSKEQISLHAKQNKTIQVEVKSFNTPSKHFALSTGMCYFLPFSDAFSSIF